MLSDPAQYGKHDTLLTVIVGALYWLEISWPTTRVQLKG